MSRTACMYKSQRFSRSGHPSGGSGKDNGLGDGEAKMSIQRSYTKILRRDIPLRSLNVLSPQAHGCFALPSTSMMPPVLSSFWFVFVCT